MSEADESVNPQTLEDFVVTAFERRIDRARRHFRRWGWGQIAASVLVALLGIVAAVAAALQHGGSSVVAIVAGALVAAVTALTQAWQPGARSERNNQRRVQLRQEGWDYLLSIGAYRGMGETEAWKTFAERISAVAQRTRGGAGQP